MPAANLVFGQIVHQALAAFFERARDPAEAFAQTWTAMRDADLEYAARDSWQHLHDAGRSLLEHFVREDAPRIGAEGVERAFELSVTDLEVPFVGVIDLIARLDDTRTVIDFKTAVASYQPFEVALPDQLTAYQLAEPSATQAALCVLVKTKVPKIEWHLTRRTGGELTDYLAKVQLVAHAVACHQFYRRPGKWCAWCDYLPVCLGDARQIEATLVAIP